jgi:adenosylmethionine-8-amino-7-oxononanoate aminotransferase
MITCAKGLKSGYSPIGAMIASDKLFEPFNDGKTTFGHGYTFGGHPVSSAVAMANLDIFEREGINDHVKENAPAFRATLEKLYDLPIVGDVRGEGFFYGIELVKDKATRQTFNDEESERLLRGFLTPALFEAGLYCRADDRGDPVVQLAPPLISGQGTERDPTRSCRRSQRSRPAALAWRRDHIVTQPHKSGPAPPIRPGSPNLAHWRP